MKLDVSTVPKLARSTALRYFAEAAARGSFRAASEAMRIAPSAINRQITNLERDIGLPLFERARGRAGLRLTEAGRILQMRLRSAMNELQIASDEIVALQGLQRGHVAVGVNEGVANDLMPEAVRVFRKRYPAITLAITVKSTRDLVSNLRDGEIDFAVGYNFPPDAELLFIRKTAFKMFLLIAREHRLASRERVSLDDLNGLDMILPHGSLLLRQMLDVILRSAGVRLNSIVDTNSFELIRLLAESGVGASIITGLDNRGFGRNRTLHVEIDDPMLPNNILACCRLPSRGLSVAAEAFIELVCAGFEAMRGIATTY